MPAEIRDFGHELQSIQPRAGAHGRAACCADRLRPAVTMSLDDLVLSLQRAIDRLIRRLRRGGAPVPHAPAAPDRADRRPVARRPRAGTGVGAHALPQAIAAASRLPAGADDGRPADLDAGLPDGGDVRRAPRHPGLPLLRPGAARPTSTSRGRATRRWSRPSKRRAGAASCTAAARTAASLPAAPTTTSSASPASRGPPAAGCSARSRPSWWWAGCA